MLPSIAGDAPAAAVLFGLAALLVAAKVGGLLALRIGQPAVLGELLIGIGVGNLLPLAFGASGITFVREEPTLHVLAELGVLLLLFDVGLECDLRALARVGSSALLVALLGICVPFGLGWGVATLLLPEAHWLVPVFLGAALTATSVGITARVLKDLGVSQSRAGQIILGAAVLDDVLGLVVLAVVTGLVASEGGGAVLSGGAILAIAGKAAAFLGIAALAGHFCSGPIVRAIEATRQHGLLLISGVALCFTLAFAAESIGLAGIIGAFAAGIMLDPYGSGVRTRFEEKTLNELLHPLATIFVPLFFVLMGIQVEVASLGAPGALGLGAALVVAAILGKLACGFGVLDRGTNRLAVAIGMVPRGEVGLIFAGIGISLTLQGRPLIDQSTFSALVLMVLVTTLVAPIGLRWAFARER